MTLGQCIEEAIVSSFVRKDESGNLQLEVRSSSSDRYKSISEGPGRLITNVPEAVRLGEATTERESNSREDWRWETTWQNIQLGEVGDGFVAYATLRSSTGCQVVDGRHIVVLAGEVPVLEYGTAYQQWAEQMEGEAYEHLAWCAQQADKKVRHSLDFAAGMAACGFAPHDQRRKAWVATLRGLGVEGDLSRIIGSVRTATVKAALALGWQPSLPKPRYWKGLPAGVVEIAL